MNAHVPTATIALHSQVVPAQPILVQSGLTDILARQRAAFLRDGTPTLAARRADLAKLKKAVRANLPEFAKTLDADFEALRQGDGDPRGHGSGARASSICAATSNVDAPEAREIALLSSRVRIASSISRLASSASCRRGTTPWGWR